jgi:hypothetical protein
MLTNFYVKNVYLLNLWLSATVSEKKLVEVNIQQAYTDYTSSLKWKCLG